MRLNYVSFNDVKGSSFLICAMDSDHDTGLHDRSVDLADGVDEASISESEVLLDSDIPVLLDSGAHDFFEAGVDNFDLIGTFDLRSLLSESHEFKKSGLGFLLIFLGHTSWGDVVEILEPLEVGAGNTPTIDEHVWGADNTSSGENLFGSVGGWSIGSLENGLDLDKVSISSVERFLSGGRDHAVSLLEEELLRVLSNSFGSIWEAGKRSVLDHVSLDSLDIETIRVMYGRVVLNNSGNLTTILLDELGSPVADSTETLNDE